MCKLESLPDRPNLEVIENMTGKDGGPCRGRTYGPLIKEGERAIFDKARYCNGFPKLVAISLA